MNGEELKVWWIPQVPGDPFFVPVNSVLEGVKIMDTLAEYDQFQLDHNIKPDYCNAGGIMVKNENGEWEDWYDPETGEDDPREWIKEPV